MIIFFISVAALILGYLIYGTLVNRIFGIDPDREPPAITQADGVDFVAMPTWKVMLVQLLNIAGVGPIFGPILGALYGPSALIWIVIGSIFAGGVHDYFSGMLSIRHNGDSIPEIVGYSLGNLMKQFMRGFSVILLLLVGIVFVSAPAQLLTGLTGIGMPVLVAIIFAYYFIATILPVDKIIGRIYPIFGFALVFMAVSLITMLMIKGYDFYPQRSLSNLSPQNLPMWPLMFITIACGAISGFHATQSPLMARCLTNERYGHPVFYGSMIMEGIIALIWATLAMSFFHNPEELNSMLSQGGPATVVNHISTTLLGGAGGILAIIGVVFLPVSSGDTAFRSARLIIADFLHFSQKKNMNRLLIAVPLFVVGFIVSKTDFGLIWRYFGWANQTLATIVLWTAAVYLSDQKKFHWIASIPAVFMTVVVTTFLCYSDIGLSLSMPMATGAGIVAAILCAVLFLRRAARPRHVDQSKDNQS
ncbi:MAG: carbon starvation protein A [Deltaproteobacteria bacterium]|nr:carbon starvation protein A [Deltaproteobacteria bacterium]